MADLFLTKTRVAAADLVEAGGRPVLERHAELTAMLSDRAGPEVAALFAEPLISRGNDAAPPTVSWYAKGTGEARALSDLPPAEQDRAASYLSEHLRPLRRLAADPACADLVLGALSLLGGDDVMVVGDRPVIVNWGLLPGGHGASVAERPSHYRNTLGRYLPFDPAGPETGPAAPADPQGSVPQPSAQGPARLSALSWAPLAVLLVLAALVLGWLLQPGTRLFPPDRPTAVDDASRLAAQKALNAALRDRRDQLQAALDGAVCRADGVLLLPDGLTPEGLLPPPVGTAPPDKAEVSPDSLLPNRAGRVLVPGGDADGVTLLDWIEARTVLVLAEGAGDAALGSGFVVAPGRVLTNQHVIADAEAAGGAIMVAAKGLEGPRPARVVAMRGPLAETGGDFALLDIGEADLPAFPLRLSGSPLKLQQVIAAGFPGDALELDAGFAALRKGAEGAMPDLTVTDGIVNTEQRIGPETRVLMHSAPLSAGNSGGPLVDMCGRVVGINSFVRKGPLQNRGYALPVTDIVAFLEGAGVTPEISDADCAPVVVRAGAAPEQAEKPAQPGATPDAPAKE